MKKKDFLAIPAKVIYKEFAEMIKKRKKYPEYKFFIKRLDELTWGIPKGGITIIGARTSEGKTSFASQVAFMNASNGKSVVYISREDTKYKIFEKICCNYFSIPNYKLKQGEVEILLSKNLSIFELVDILILDDYGANFEELEQIITTLEPMPELIFIDYIQLIRNVKGFSRKDSIEEFIRACKNLCNATGVSIIIVSQVNRTAQNKRPSLWMLKDSGAIEESADLVLLLHYPYKYELLEGKEPEKIEYSKNLIEIIIAKNKEGELGIVKTKFTGEYYRFEDYQQGLY